jgi:hypothetical protein
MSKQERGCIRKSPIPGPVAKKRLAADTACWLARLGPLGSASTAAWAIAVSAASAGWVASGSSPDLRFGYCLLGIW